MVAKYFAPFRLSRAFFTSGMGNASLAVTLFNHGKVLDKTSIQNLNVSSFFRTMHTGELHGEHDGSMTPVANISSSMASSESLAERAGRRGGCFMGLASPVSISC